MRPNDEHAQAVKRMHRQLLKVGKEIDQLEETIAVVQSPRERKVMNNQLDAYFRTNVRQNVLSRRAKECEPGREMAAMNMQAAVMFAQSAIFNYIASLNDTTPSANKARKRAA
jgi:hypothetical protein